MLPEGGKLNDANCAQLITRLNEAIRYARTVEELKRDPEARARWHEIYEELSGGHTGLLGAVTSRAEAQVMRLACIYAALDCSNMVRLVHLEAARALWLYCEASARYVFGEATGDRVADAIMTALRDAGSDGLTQTALYDLFSRHKSGGAINRALTTLAEQRRVTSKDEDTGGRPVKRWFAVTQAANKAKEANKGADGDTSFASFAYFASPENECLTGEPLTDEEAEYAARLEYENMPRAEAERLARARFGGVPF